MAGAIRTFWCITKARNPDFQSFSKIFRFFENLGGWDKGRSASDTFLKSLDQYGQIDISQPSLIPIARVF
jgi:hypothetical protein